MVPQYHENWKPRVLGLELYGACNYAAALVQYLSLLLLPGLFPWGERAIAKTPKDVGVNLVLVNTIQFLLALPAYGVLAAFTCLTVTDPTQRSVILLTGIGLFCVAISLGWVLQGMELPRYFALSQALAATIGMLWLFYFVRTRQDVYYYVCMNLVMQLVGLVGCAFFLFRHKVGVSAPLSDRCCSTEWRSRPERTRGSRRMKYCCSR